MPQYSFERRLGAFPLGDGRAEVRVWAPRPGDGLRLRAGGREHVLEDAGFGIREAVIDLEPGADYAYAIEGVELPDPCSRWQPDGLRGPSRLLDTTAFEWTDEGFTPAPLDQTVVYELHVGTFTPEGTFGAATAELPGLAELGVTHVEIMPVAEFPGRRGWGYDGVYLSAAQSSYGGPFGLQRLVDAAHAAGLGVILDVVYNHVGASGTQALEAFGPYLTDKHETFWGRGMNYDDSGSDAVREWALQSAEGWLRDFHFDGLRLDAINAITDDNPEHVVAAIARRAHAARPHAVVIAESGLNDPKVMRPAPAGWGCDAAWADDFHHAFRALVTGERDGWYADFGAVADLAKAYRRPHVHDGTWSGFRDRRFGAPAHDVPPERFVVFTANHDQVGNRAFGDRLPAEVRPIAAFLTLLSPFTPMLFQGEEHGERAPFQFFTDHIDEEIAVATREGRRREFAAFSHFAGEEVPDPQDPGTFERSKLTGAGEPPGLRELHARLIEARRALGGAGDAEAVDHDEHQGWLRVRRAGHTLLANLSRASVHVPVAGSVETVLTTHHVTLEPGYAVLPPLSGALVR